MQEIYRDEDLIVRMVPQGRMRRWVVTFEMHVTERQPERRAFGERFLRRIGMSAIHVLARGNHWYNYPGTPHALHAIRTALDEAGARRIVTYGSSMGAYAAIRFAPSIRATGILALSPQYSIDRAIMPEEDRWQDEARDIVWQADLAGPLLPCAPTVVVYDPRDADARQVARIAQDIPIIPILAPYVGHPATAFMAQQKLVEPMLDSLLRNRFNPVAAQATVKQALKTSSTYLTGLARHQPRHRTALAIRLARHALSLAAEADRPPVHHALAQLLSRAGAHDEAIAHAAIAVEASERNLGYLFPFGEVLLAAGRIEETKAIAEEMMARAGHRSEAHALLGMALQAGGDTAGARKCLMRAAALNPAYEPLVPPVERQGGLRAVLREGGRLIGLHRR